MFFQPTHLPAPSKYFDTLVINYLSNNEHLKNLFKYSPDWQGLFRVIEDIQKINYNRKELKQILLQQSQRVTNTSEKTINNINLLSEKNSYTITTGHQLCLFTGPLYFIYKIASLIQLSKQFKEQLPDYHFIPVFWMATEDHDMEEINHFYYKEKIIRWNRDTDRSPVFSINTNGLSDVFEEIKNNKILSEDDLNLFFTAYLHHNNYVDATRYLVNHLFGHEGIVIIDANEKYFKQQFQSVFHKDIFENYTYHSMMASTDKLKNQHYNIQVNPREINTFLIYNHQRHLVQKKESYYLLKNTDVIFSQSELEEYLKTHPEYFSPNVLLRPLYQQTILPNIAYIGGPAEVAYWLELSNSFDAYNILYPIILQRPVIFLLPTNIQQKINKLHLSIHDIFTKDKDKIIKDILDKQHMSISLDEQRQDINNIYEKIKIQTERIDKTLLPFVNAELTRALRGIEALEQKLNRTIKQKNEIIVKQTEDIFTTFFPNNTMQDRIWNASYALKVLGYSSIKEFITSLLPYCKINFSEKYQITVLEKL